jgi:hypothetical protein
MERDELREYFCAGLGAGADEGVRPTVCLVGLRGNQSRGRNLRNRLREIILVR